ncbi:MAG: DUF1361 domain-containing protein [Verrucomicrobiaceae bacterium]|nr:DUF1361 domain-containing protein [Verrucomicrobiaceae bacterium]
MTSDLRFREVVLLFLAGCWCVFLSILVFGVMRVTEFRFMPWNLFLACIPYALSFWLRWIPSVKLGGLVLLPWLLFFPNAPYLLTDLLHIQKLVGHEWHGLLLLVSFALVGLMVTFSSLGHVHQWLEAKMGFYKAWLGVAVISMLTGFGIYLGRFLRWNSWDILRDPVGLIQDIAVRVLLPHHHLRTWGVTLGFGALLLLIYAHHRLIFTRAKN